MEEKELTEFIDLYLFGRITSNDWARLEYLRKTNPAVDIRISESIEAFKVLKYLRYKELRQQLYKIDTADDRNANLRDSYSWIFITSIFVIAFICFWFWTGLHYKPESIAIRYFNSTPEMFSLYQEMNESDLKHWSMAIKAFNERDFTLAIEHFQSLEKNENYEISNAARWNGLLAHFALNGSDITWQAEMKQLMEATTIEPLHTRSKQLLQTVKSPVYRFFNQNMYRQLSALKPRLM